MFNEVGETVHTQGAAGVVLRNRREDRAGADVIDVQLVGVGDLGRRVAGVADH